MCMGQGDVGTAFGRGCSPGAWRDTQQECHKPVPWGHLALQRCQGPQPCLCSESPTVGFNLRSSNRKALHGSSHISHNSEHLKAEHFQCWGSQVCAPHKPCVHSCPCACSRGFKHTHILPSQLEAALRSLSPVSNTTSASPFCSSGVSGIFTSLSKYSCHPS